MAMFVYRSVRIPLHFLASEEEGSQGQIGGLREGETGEGWNYGPMAAVFFLELDLKYVKSLGREKKLRQPRCQKV